MSVGKHNWESPGKRLCACIEKCVRVCLRDFCRQRRVVQRLTSGASSGGGERRKRRRGSEAHGSLPSPSLSLCVRSSSGESHPAKPRGSSLSSIHPKAQTTQQTHRRLWLHRQQDRESKRRTQVGTRGHTRKRTRLRNGTRKRSLYEKLSVGNGGGKQD